MFSNPADYLIVLLVVGLLYFGIRAWIIWSIYWCDPRWDPPKLQDPIDPDDPA